MQNLWFKIIEYCIKGHPGNSEGVRISIKYLIFKVSSSLYYICILVIIVSLSTVSISPQGINLILSRHVSLVELGHGPENTSVSYY